MIEILLSLNYKSEYISNIIGVSVTLIKYFFQSQNPVQLYEIIIANV